MNEFESEWTSLSQSFVQNGWILDSRIQGGCHHQVYQMEISLRQSQSGVRVFLSANLSENNKMSEFQDGTAIIKLSQNWMTLSQIELDWVRVTLPLCNMAKSKMAEFKMVAII